MNPLLLYKAGVTVKRHLALSIAITTVLFALPFAAFFAVLDPTSVAANPGALYTGTAPEADTYAWGNCTWWVFILRQQNNEPIPNTWGNASSWATNALLDGYSVDNTPTNGSIMQISTVDNGLGHVAFVTNVDAVTGAWTISEMNVLGLDEVDTKTLPASAAIGFNFIHEPTGLGY
jgi:surface antigen